MVESRNQVDPLSADNPANGVCGGQINYSCLSAGALWISESVPQRPNSNAFSRHPKTKDAVVLSSDRKEE